MKRKIVYSMTLLLIIGLVTSFLIISRGRASQPIPSSSVNPELKSLVAAPGRVEPISEEINLGADISGKIKEVLVEEGDQIKEGQVIAVLENDDYRAQVSSAEAMLKLKEAELRRIINGARNQERRGAWAEVKEAQAVMKNAQADLERRRALYRKGIIAREEVERTERDYNVAKARYEATVEHHSLIDDEAREEDRSKAEADVALAKAEQDEAQAILEKTIIRSPVTGVVLRKHLNAGEVVSNTSNITTPIVTVADNSTLRVRVDVDETDVGKVEIDQKAYVTADAYGNEKFWGRVVRIGQVLGKKSFQTDEPTERVDTKVLETLIELDNVYKLPIGLRVDTFIIVNKEPGANLTQTSNR
ncbi:MAG: HlyD family efflux transporter periplasmic adaptor subunit [Candidatus Dadabacteria bacterium]|nr:HlyD family efflux transporter periplasmic adaptor subunit [Candidatus Dadabacteria bacterium]